MQLEHDSRPLNAINTTDAPKDTKADDTSQTDYGFVGFGLPPDTDIMIPEWEENPSVGLVGDGRSEITIRLPNSLTSRVRTHLIRHRMDLLDARLMMDYKSDCIRITGMRPSADRVIRDAVLCCDSKGYAQNAERYQTIIGEPSSTYELKWVNREVKSHDGEGRWNMLLLREHIPTPETEEGVTEGEQSVAEKEKSGDDVLGSGNGTQAAKHGVVMEGTKGAAADVHMPKTVETSDVASTNMSNAQNGGPTSVTDTPNSVPTFQPSFQTLHTVGTPTDSAIATAINHVTSHIQPLRRTLTDPRDKIEFATWYGRTYFFPQPRNEDYFTPETAYEPKRLENMLIEREVRSVFMNRVDPTFPPFCQESLATSQPPYTTTQSHILQLSLIDLHTPTLPSFTIKLTADPHFLSPPLPALPYNAPFIPPKEKRLRTAVSSSLTNLAPPDETDGGGGGGRQSAAPVVKSARKQKVESVLVREEDVEVLGISVGGCKTFVEDFVCGPDRWYHDLRVGVSVKRCVDVPQDGKEEQKDAEYDDEIKVDFRALKDFLTHLRILEVINTPLDASKKKRKRARYVPCFVYALSSSSPSTPLPFTPPHPRYIIKHARRIRRTTYTPTPSPSTSQIPAHTTTLDEIDEIPPYFVAAVSAQEMSEAKRFGMGAPKGAVEGGERAVEGVAPFWEVRVAGEVGGREIGEEGVRGVVEGIVKRAVEWNVDE
ncbi:hypothetical protein HDV00_001012 [Rhizophlyctis rosea]|nr:hypothetical protein HDV00_001012 [Rhizophlyctis rosea]